MDYRKIIDSLDETIEEFNLENTPETRIKILQMSANTIERDHPATVENGLAVVNLRVEALMIDLRERGI